MRAYATPRQVSVADRHTRCRTTALYWRPETLLASPAGLAATRNEVARAVYVMEAAAFEKVVDQLMVRFAVLGVCIVVELETYLSLYRREHVAVHYVHWKGVE